MPWDNYMEETQTTHKNERWVVYKFFSQWMDFQDISPLEPGTLVLKMKSYSFILSQTLTWEKMNEMQMFKI